MARNCAEVFKPGQLSEDMIPTVGFNMRKITKGNVTIKWERRQHLKHENILPILWSARRYLRDLVFREF